MKYCLYQYILEYTIPFSWLVTATLKYTVGDTSDRVYTASGVQPLLSVCILLFIWLSVLQCIGYCALQMY